MSTPPYIKQLILNLIVASERVGEVGADGAPGKRILDQQSFHKHEVEAALTAHVAAEVAAERARCVAIAEAVRVTERASVDVAWSEYRGGRCDIADHITAALRGEAP